MIASFSDAGKTGKKQGIKKPATEAGVNCRLVCWVTEVVLFAATVFTFHAFFIGGIGFLGLGGFFSIATTTGESN